MLHLFLLSILTYTLSCASAVDSEGFDPEINNQQTAAHLTYSKNDSGSTLKIQTLQDASRPSIEVVDNRNISSSDNDPGRAIVVFKTTGTARTPVARAQIQFAQEDYTCCHVHFESMTTLPTGLLDSETLACIESFPLKKNNGVPAEQRNPYVEPFYGNDEFVCADITYYLPEAQNGDRYSVCFFMDLARPLGFCIKVKKCAQNAGNPDTLFKFRYNTSTSTLERRR